MYLKLLTPKSEIPMPFTLQEAKDFLRVDGSADDDLITSLIKAAVQHIQGVTNRQLLRVTFQLTLDRLPSSISLPRPPFAHITSITATDENGQEVVFEDTYYTYSDDEYTTLTGITGTGWYNSSYKKAVIVYEAGYETPADIPEDIILALKALITFFYENRGEANKPIPEFIYNLLSDHRIYSF